jgi:hypothetical protein
MRNRLLLQNHEAFIIEDNDLLTRVDYVSVGDNFTFGDLWKLITLDVAFFEKVFKVALGYYELAPFIKDGANPDTDISDEPDEDGIMFGLEVSSSFESRNFKQKIYIQSDFDFHGYGKDNKGKDQLFGVSFQPLSALMSYPFRVTPQARFYVIEKHKTTVDHAGSYEMLLFDMLYAIFDEITFYGNPSDRAKTLADLDQKMSTIKDELRDDK